ncbi:hypothetical protein CA51_10990 [Rosistilla oblonga]|uniref:hypothetical protein n=1 Tax=Rosistilla oblonga TaxID=2527990 RepID=UPI00118BF075|nr:hypothetical protein [Rosistilla oblonga]QDV11238.1 hypothetical protein CA51_10990 [Rosistilla oblonga]
MKLSDLIDPLMVLLSDAHAAEQLLDAADGQFERRAYIRSTMATIEGAIWLLKQTCLKAHAPRGAKRMSIAEYAMLSDETYDLKNNGDVRTSTKFLKLPDNLRFTVQICNRLFGCEMDLQVGAAPWDRFLKAVAIRNRIMHPKVSADFEITDQEIDDCKNVVGWFNTMFHDFVMQLTKNAENFKPPSEA